MPRTSTVFVTQRSKDFDYSDLSRYGQVRFLTQRSIYPDEVDEYLPVLLRAIGDELRPYVPSLDWICLAADPAIIAIVVAMATVRAGFSHGTRKLRLLKWDGQECAYYPIELSINDIGRAP